MREDIRAPRSAQLNFCAQVCKVIRHFVGGKFWSILAYILASPRSLPFGPNGLNELIKIYQDKILDGRSGTSLGAGATPLPGFGADPFGADPGANPFGSLAARLGGSSFIGQSCACSLADFRK